MIHSYRLSWLQNTVRRDHVTQCSRSSSCMDIHLTDGQVLACQLSSKQEVVTPQYADVKSNFHICKGRREYHVIFNEIHENTVSPMKNKGNQPASIHNLIFSRVCCPLFLNLSLVCACLLAGPCWHHGDFSQSRLAVSHPQAPLSSSC